MADDRVAERAVRATYRLQLRPGFGFAEAAAVVPYLASLGVSHLYLSPPFEAAEGSTHGYDVVDPNRLRAALGGRDAFDAMVAVAHEHGLGVVVDVVPHHMAATADNAWWWSVLELGESSPYARHFDIDWNPPSRRLRGTVLLPVLGDHYGRVVDAGELHLERGRDDAIVARYYDHVAPLSPDTADELWAIAGRRGCPVDDVLTEVNADPARVDAILDRQHHRFARWQTAAHELDYRRFFDIDSLVALRSERPDVFADYHRLVLVTTGRVDGLRIDHVDGLRDPASYLEHLRDLAPDTWLVVEKILRPDEELPPWPIDGTTGYDFLAHANGLLTDERGVDALVRAYQHFTGDDTPFDAVRADARRSVLEESLDADLERLLAVLLRVCEHRRRWRDFTRAELRDGLVAVLGRFGAYRTYARAGEAPREADVRLVAAAIDAAAADRPDLDVDLLELFRALLTGALTGDAEAEAVARFQQLSGPVAAKGEEDTAFYRWTPLLSWNEVGAEPDHPSLTPSEFHEECAARQQRWPTAMVTTSTHDTKRSEDVRARLALLTEIPDEWAGAVAHWSSMNNHARDVELDAPDRHDEWFAYQTLVGAHPLPLDRLWPVMEKSMREAKRRTSWVRPDDAYEHAVHRFCDTILRDERFLAELDRFVAPLVDPGRVNALTLTTLRLLASGVPDTYQGTELWDDSLVDPDNRRPVDFDGRRAILQSLDGRTAADAWRDDRASGLPKLALVHACLALRRRRPRAFGPHGAYTALGTGGDVLAFQRGDDVAVAVPLRPMKGAHGDAKVELPRGAWRNVLTGEEHTADEPVRFDAVRGGFPVAVLERVSA